MGTLQQPPLLDHHMVHISEIDITPTDRDRVCELEQSTATRIQLLKVFQRSENSRIGNMQNDMVH